MAFLNVRRGRAVVSWRVDCLSSVADMFFELDYLVVSYWLSGECLRVEMLLIYG